MLIRFSVANWRSIRETQEVSFVASNLTDEGADLIHTEAIGETILPTIAVYGANASGKSNLIEALRTLRTLVIHSHRKSGPGEPLPIQSFTLDQKHVSLPTIFELDFILSDVRYQFRLTATTEKVIEESLHAFPSKRAQLWYSRAESNFEFGRSLKGKNVNIQELTRPNSLFLSAAATSNHEQLTLMFNFFRDSVSVYEDLPSFATSTYARYVDDADKKARVLSVLRNADIGIEDISAKEAAEPDEKQKAFQIDLEAVIKKYVGGDEEVDLSGRSRRELLFTHRGSDGTGTLGLNAESRGTRQLLNLLPPVFDVLETGGTLIIDELDTSLHPLLAKEVIRLFQKSTSNRLGAQLLFTTHDASLLTRDLLRRDQIWFTEKDHCGASSVYALSDIKTRNTDNIQKGYLEGRYGAIPYLGELRQIFAGEEKMREPTSN